MKLESNYEKCVILNDLQRQLEYHEINKNDMVIRVWDVWYDGVYMGSINKIDRCHLIYTTHPVFEQTGVYDSFMEALAVYVEHVVQYYEESSESVKVADIPKETPEKTIWSEIKKLFWRK